LIRELKENFMQKIILESKNVPLGVQLFLARSSTNLSLNKEETLSVIDGMKDDRLDIINPEGILPEYTQGFKANYVYVLNVDGKPLMPCTPCKAKKLIKTKRAAVVKKFPFVIRLNFECENCVQDVTLGVDSGYNNIGFSAVSKTKELISGTLNLDWRTSKRLTKRKMYRNNRRSRLWHRKPRFLNRTKPKGWLPPSIQRRYDTHLNLINRIKRILPITKIIVEVASFDIQKINNPDIDGKDYQQGELYNYQNMRSYLMSREHGKCQICGKDFKNKASHIHHCKQKSESGSNRPENLAILHKNCHINLHKKGLKLLHPKSYKANTFMSIIHNKFCQDIQEVEITYGYVTFINRNKLGLEKNHANDAFVIAGGSIQERSENWNIEQKHRHNRVIQVNRKGFKPSIRTSVYKMQPKDLITIGKSVFSVISVHGQGRYVKVKGVSKSFSTKDVENVYNFGGFVWIKSLRFCLN